MRIRIYTATHCEPCRKVEELIKEGNLSEEVELVDIETDEGFLKFKEDVLDHSDGRVPSAYKEGKLCKIGLDEKGKLAFECPTDEQPTDEQSTEAPAASGED